VNFGLLFDLDICIFALLLLLLLFGFYLLNHNGTKRERKSTNISAETVSDIISRTTELACVCPHMYTSSTEAHTVNQGCGHTTQQHNEKANGHRTYTAGLIFVSFPAISRAIFNYAPQCTSITAACSFVLSLCECAERRTAKASHTHSTHRAAAFSN
jgi:hypothetical protein